MPQYLLSVHGNINDAMPSAEEMTGAYAAVDAFNHKLQESGAWVFAGGLRGAEESTIVDGTAGGSARPGRAIPGDDFLGGMWVIEVNDIEAAHALAAEASAACGSPVEVRPFQDETDA